VSVGELVDELGEDLGHRDGVLQHFADHVLQRRSSNNFLMVSRAGTNID
jgi:hypothetical protein